MKKTRLAIVAAFLLVNGVALAHAEAEIQLGESVVRPGYVEVNQLKNTKEVIVITKKDIESKNYTTLEDVLSDVPSINVGLTGWGDIDIRGQGAEQAQRNIQVMLDGAPITILTSHPYQNNYNYIPVQNIEKIEIVPGGGSVMYGSGASGGVINITTNLKNINKPQKGFSVGVSNKELNGSVAYGDRLNDKFAYQFNATRMTKDLYYVNTFLRSNYYSLGVAVDSNPTQRLTFRVSRLEEVGQNIGTLSYDKFEKYGKDYVPKDNYKTVGVESGKKIQRKFPGYLNLERDIDMYSINYVKAINEDSRLIADAFYIDGKFINSTFGSAPMSHKTKGVKVKYELGYGQDKTNKVILGLDWYNQYANLTYDDYVGGYSGKPVKVHPLHFIYDKTIKAVFAHNTINKDKWSFTQGIRFEHADWGYDKEAAKSSGVDTRKSDDIAGELGVSYQYNDTGKFYAHYEKGFTHPDGIQSSDDLGKEIVPSPVKDEHFDNFEVGWSDMLGNSFISVVGFYSETDNQIDRFLASKPGKLLRISRNVFNTTRKGIDVSATQKFGKWKFKEGYTWLKGHSSYSKDGIETLKEFKKQGYILDPSYLRGVPINKLVFQAQYSPNEYWTFTGLYKFVGRYHNYYKLADAEGNVIPSHKTFDFDISYHNKKGVDVHFGVKNMFNEKYAYFLSEKQWGENSIIPGDERTFYTSVSYKF